MITFVTTYSHNYTHTSVAAIRSDFRCISYPALLAHHSLPRGTYIFTDFDRLGFFQLELAAHVYRVLQAAGCVVLNDPARVLHRLTLLQRLYRQEINSFQAWPATDLEFVDQFPVFIRTASAHRGVLTDRLENHHDLAQALEQLLARGYPLADLIVVEYCAEPVRDDVYRKMAAYRIGDAIVPTASVHERDWRAKLGEDGVAGDQGYAEDLALMHSNPHADEIMAAFNACGADYGRADYSVVNGRPEFYEINTNPMMKGGSTDHGNADRSAALLKSGHDYAAALDALPKAADTQSIPIPRPAHFKVGKRYKRLLPGYLWLP